MKRVIALLLLVVCISLSSQSIFAQKNREGFSISKIDDALMERMKGKSFGEGCTTSQSDLRYLQVLHYDADGKVQHGELVCNKAIAQDLIEIFEALYDAQYPIEKMVLIDEYDGDDDLSMADNNTSCFNFRNVPGSKNLSRHARGMAIDINPLYNPYITKRNGKQHISPEEGKKWATNRTKSRNKMIIDANDLCLKLFKQHGFRWGGNWRSSKDYQHFDK